MSRYLSAAALSLFVLALAAPQALAETPALKVILSEDAYCGAPAETVPAPPEVARRRTEIVWPRAFDSFQSWATLAFKLRVDAGGRIAAMTIQTETPPGKGLSEAAQQVLTSWRFTPGQPGDYCLRFSLTAGGETIPPVEPASAPEPPAPIIQTIPDYPAAALGDAVEADIVLGIDIATGGVIGNVAVISESTKGYGFGQSAANSVRTWRFPSTTKPGRYHLKLKFRLA